MENTMDQYHIFHTHRRYLTEFLSSTLSARPTPERLFDSSRAMDLGNGHVNVEFEPFNPLSVEKDKRARWENLYGKERADRMMSRIQHLLLFPNTLFIEMWRAIRTCQPVSHERMEVTAWALMPRDDSAETRKVRMSTYTSFMGPGGFATPDDIEIMETLQANMRATPELQFVDYSRGMTRQQPLADDEAHLRNFWKGWYQRVGPSIETKR
jgi:p-cumate 2,3-dioxygenase alpha subunit